MPRLLHRARRGLRALVTVAVIGCSAVTVSMGAQPAAAFSCRGVAVVVDFSAFGLGVQKGCATNPANGYDALVDAGFSPRGTDNYGPAFVCQIKGQPANQSCATTPPANASWSYSYASPGDASWTYSPLGATFRRPAAGTIDAWAFGAHAQPGIAPNRAITPEPPPPTSPPPPNATAHNSGSGTHVTTGGGGSSSSAAGNPKNGSPATTPRTTTPGSIAKAQAANAKAAAVAKRAEQGRADSGSTTTQANALPADERASGSLSIARHSDSGSPLPVIFTVFAILAIAAVTIVSVQARRRRAS